jgi:DNA-binding transcriptional LysR family regulator
MDIRVLKYFLAVTKEENISKAAEMLHLTQPTLSRQLAQLEEEVGAQLFTRGKSFTLTEAGLIFKRRAEEIVDISDKIGIEITESENELRGEISIGCSETQSYKILPDIIEAFKKKHPAVQFHIFIGNADSLNENLDKGLLDLCIQLEPTDVEKYNFRRIPIDEYNGVLMPSDCELAKHEFVTAEDLKNLPLIMAKRHDCHNVVANWFGNGYDKLNFAFSYNLVSGMIPYVERRQGYMLVVENAVKPYMNENLCFKRLTPELVLNSVVVWKKYQTYSKTISRFIEFVREFEF